jgi:predicted NACHT family NTPase
MSGWTKNLLLPLLLISSNGLLGWLINQLQPKSDSVSNSTILGLTIGCILFQVILTILSNDSQQQNSTSPNQANNNNWIGGFLPLLGGGILTTLLYLKLVPTGFNAAISYASLVMFALGAILPPVLILPKKWRKWLIWLIPGAGLFLTIHLINQKQLIPAIVSLVLTGLITGIIAAHDFIKILITELSAVWEQYQRQGAVSAATWIKNKFEMAISPFQSDYYKALEYKCRKFETQGLDSPFNLDLKNVFVPLKISADRVHEAKQDIMPQSKNKVSNLDNKREYSILDFLAANKSEKKSERKQSHKLVILGRPGSGKTTLLRHLTLIYATKQESQIFPRPPQLIPILLYLRENIQKQLTTLPQHFTNAEAFIKHIRDDCGLLVEKEIGIFEFAHLSFQEYLAAVEIKELNQEDILIGNINNSWWAETIRLYAAVNDATNLIRAVINMPVPSINAFLVVADYEEEGWRIDNQVRQQISDKLDAGLESDDSEIFKLAAEVKLAKRLNNLVRVDENLEVDNSCITCAEYKLFLWETGYKSPQNWQNQSFGKGTAKNIVDGITLEDANQFCVWLSLKDINNQLDKLVTWYRLPTPKERKQYNIPEENKTKIRLVRCKLPLKYSQLAEYLMRGKWREADEETLKVMLQVSGKENQGYLDVDAIDNFPCEDLRIIDTLWVSASNGHFGFSVQKEIYQSLGGKREYNEKVWNAFGDRVGWKKGGSWLMWNQYTFNLNAPGGHIPIGGRVGDRLGGISSLAQRLVDCNI